MSFSNNFSRGFTPKETEEYVLLLMNNHHHYGLFTLADLAGTTEMEMFKLCDRLKIEGKIFQDPLGRYYKLMEGA